MGLIPVGTPEWWQGAFPLSATIRIDGWEFDIHLFDPEYEVPRFNTANLLLTARLTACVQHDPKIRGYWPCNRCRQYASVGEVRCVTADNHEFHFPFHGGCKCPHNGGGLNRLLSGISAAHVLYAYMEPEKAPTVPNPLVQHLIDWGWKQTGIEAANRFTAEAIRLCYRS